MSPSIPLCQNLFPGDWNHLLPEDDPLYGPDEDVSTLRTFSEGHTPSTLPSPHHDYDLSTKIKQNVSRTDESHPRRKSVPSPTSPVSPWKRNGREPSSQSLPWSLLVPVPLSLPIAINSTVTHGLGQDSGDRSNGSPDGTLRPSVHGSPRRHD